MRSPAEEVHVESHSLHVVLKGVKQHTTLLLVLLSPWVLVLVQVLNKYYKFQSGMKGRP